jgi:hypothetical protein
VTPPRHEKSADKDEIMTEFPGNQPPPPPQPSSIDPAQPTTPPPVPPYAPTIYTEPKEGPSALKIVLIIVGIFVGLGLIAAGFAGYGFYKFAKSSNFTTSSQPVTEADLGVPLYPGAEQGKASVRMTIVGKNMLTATLLTSDSKDQVIAFYRSNLGPDAQGTNTSRGETFMLDKGSGESVVVTISQNPSLAGGQTQIVIMHATKAAAPSN